MRTVALILFVVVDLLGIAGAVMVVIPIKRDHGLRQLLKVLTESPPIPGLEDAERRAVTGVRSEIATGIRPADRAYITWGVIIIAFSYLLHIGAEFLEYFSKD